MQTGFYKIHGFLNFIVYKDYLKKQVPIKLSYTL